MTPRWVVDRALESARSLASRRPSMGPLVEYLDDRALESARSLASRRPSMGPLVEYLDETARREADASTERWRQGRAIGPLDGVPIDLKEELAVRGLPTRGGSDLSDATPAAEDATLVTRLRSAGAIVLGHAPMTEYGMTPLGFNPKRTMPRNPHGPPWPSPQGSSRWPSAVTGEGRSASRPPCAACSG
jgi:aspartyl-tRNA(Asn)/glutamyl-tRNA(Gln) amidotransferase subunit A